MNDEGSPERERGRLATDPECAKIPRLRDGVNSIDFDAIRARNPLPEYCDRRGIKLRRSGGNLVGKCPLHNEHHGAAFVVFDDGRWHCFGKCGKRGDVIDLEQALGGGTLVEAAERLGQVRTEPLASISRRKPITAASHPTRDNPFGLPHRMSETEMGLCVEAASRLVHSDVLIKKVASWRKWKPETVRNLALEPSLGIDASGKLCFLYETGCKVRWRQNGERQIRWAFGKPCLWRVGFIKRAETVFICEGETDAITLLDSGIERDAHTLVIALPSASFHIQRWGTLFDGKRVVIATDWDPAGNAAAEHLIAALTPFAKSVGRLVLGKGLPNV